MSSTSCEHTWENFELRGDFWECQICGVKIQEEELPSIKEYDQKIEELRARLRESQQREAQWKKIAEEARGTVVLDHSVISWIEKDENDRLRQQIDTLTNERDRAIVETAEQCAQVCRDRALLEPHGSWAFVARDCAQLIESKFAHVAQQDEATTEGTSTRK